MELSADWLLLRNFAIAMAIGALVGVEREKNREVQGSSFAGLRTFILIAEAGSLSCWLARELAMSWLFGFGLLALALLLTLENLHRLNKMKIGNSSDSTGIANNGNAGTATGMTTSIAALVVFLLGAVTVSGYPELAVALAVVTSAVLAYRDPLHGLVHKIGSDDLFAGLKLLIAIFIVLPLLPNRTIDPWRAFNPFQLGLLVITLSTLSLVGYVAIRWLGHKRGTALTALAGGLVSSTAVTLSFARRSRELPQSSQLLFSGVLLAWAVMYARVMVVIAVVFLPLFFHILAPMLTLTLFCAGLAWYQVHQSSLSQTTLQDDLETPALSNPFSLIAATKFALLLSVIFFIVKLTQLYLPDNSLYAVAAMAGLADVDSVSLSFAALVRDGGNVNNAARAILIATLANTLTKTALMFFLADSRIRRDLSLATVGIAVISLLFLFLV